MWCPISQKRPVGDRVPSRSASTAGGDVAVRVDRLADVVEQGRQQEFLVVGPLAAGQFEDLEAVVERVPLGMPLRVLLHGRKWIKPHLVDRESVDVVGHASDLGRGLVVAIFRAGVVDGEVGPIGEHLGRELPDLGIGGQVAGPDGVPQDGRGLTLGGVELGLGRLAQPAPAIGLSELAEQPPGRLAGDLEADPVAGTGGSMALLELVVHGPDRDGGPGPRTLDER